MDNSENISLSPAEALALAGRAKAAAERPVPLPGWYGPTFGAAFSVYGIVLGQAMQHEVRWLSIAAGPAWAVFVSVLAGLASRASGVMRLKAAGFGGYITGAVLVTLALGIGVGFAAWALTGALGWAMTAFGVTSGASFWSYTVAVNKRIERRNAGTGQ